MATPCPRNPSPAVSAALLALLTLPLLLTGAVTAPAAIACQAEPLPCHPLPPEPQTVKNRLTITKISWGQSSSPDGWQHLYVEIDGQKVWGPTWTTQSSPGQATVNVTRVKSGDVGPGLARIQVRDAADSNDPVGPEVLAAATASTTPVTRTVDISKPWRPIRLTYTVRRVA